MTENFKGSSDTGKAVLTQQEKNVMQKLIDRMEQEHVITPGEKVKLTERIREDSI
ncbi:MAG: hypothetical protein Q4C91_16380 [Eubacteriales bacterium]|nr:hypothetical protein [Eubacteriales bacterium]